MTKTCKPLPRVKVAGGSDVTVVWARARLETAAAESSATKRTAAKRCEDIMTCLARCPQRGGTGSRHVSNESFIPSLSVGARPPHGTPHGCGPSVTKPRDNGGYSPYLPAAGLYSL